MRRTLEALDQKKESGIDTNTVYRAVCHDIVENVGSNRVSIWHFNSDRTKIVCDCYYIAEDNRFSSGAVLSIAVAPTYFEAILTEKYIVAPQARVQRSTRELRASYFEPNNIYSLLDYIIYEDYSPVGIICCEQAYSHRDWQESDKNYLLTISTLISFSFPKG